MNGKLPYSKDSFVEAETEKDFRSMLWDILEYNASCNVDKNRLCADRAVACSKEYVPKRWLKYAAILFVGVSIGTGVIGYKVIIPFIVKVAVAGI